jgi:hypothetical protein
MTNMRMLARTVTALAAVCVLGIGCTESYRSTGVQKPTPDVEAALVVSNLAAVPGSSIVVALQATTSDASVGSYTARINYDPAALRFDGEVSMGDNALRAFNPKPGLLRLAGAAATGFASGRLASYNFTVLRAQGAGTLSLAIDEIHMMTRVDAKANLTIAPSRTTSR